MCESARSRGKSECGVTYDQLLCWPSGSRERKPGGLGQVACERRSKLHPRQHEVGFFVYVLEVESHPGHRL